VTYHADTALPCFDAGEPVVLMPEPSNTHDCNAIKVMGGTDFTSHCGCVPAPLARKLAASAKDSKGAGFVVQSYSNEDGHRVGLRIVAAFDRPIDVKPGSRVQD
jgi:hypothetical protein